MTTFPLPSAATHRPLGVHDTPTSEPPVGGPGKSTGPDEEMSIFVAVQELGSAGLPTKAWPP